MTDSSGSPSFWLLNQTMRWHEGEVRDLTFGADLRLAPLPNGPLSLSSTDGSLGGRALPRYMALDEELRLHLLLPNDGIILRYDPRKNGRAPNYRGGFVRLQGIGGRGRDDRELWEPRGIAIAGPHLYVADTGNRQVKVFGLDRSLPLLHIFGPRDAGPRQTWWPVDVTEADGRVFILDSKNSRIYRHRRGTDRLVAVSGPEVEAGSTPNHWTRLVSARDGCIVLLDDGGQTPAVDVYNPKPAKGARHWRRMLASEDIGGLFEPAPVRVYENCRRGASPAAVFVLPASLAADCARSRPQEPLPAGRPKPGTGDLVFDLGGHRAQPNPSEWLAPPMYTESGGVVIGPLDSGLYRCQWHRVELEFGDLPPGTHVTISTVTGAAAYPGPSLSSGPGWSEPLTLYGPPQAPESRLARIEDALVQSSVGQHLWLQLTMNGDGFRSPALKALRVHFPRQTYLRYLPSVYSADDAQRSFLERFLAIFQTTWDELEQKVTNIRCLFDPTAAPDEGLDLLAQLLAVPLEATWTATQKRMLLAAVPEFFTRRGTPDGVQRFVQAYLEILSAGQSRATDYPVFVEGFRYRHRIMLGQGAATFGDQPVLWGQAQVARLQLDSDAQLGAVRLVSTADPARDVFHAYAHRFKVFVPAAWIKDAAAERMLRRAIEAEKPAHTAYDLCLVEPRFRIGIQSTVGFDTIIGDTPTARLTSVNNQADDPPARPPRNVLGYDSILGGAPADPPSLSPATAARIGIDTRLK